jgi:hypothetical protein
MNKYEFFQADFLFSLRNGGRDVKPGQLASQYDIPETHVREKLLRWAEEGLISLGAFDGYQVLSWECWDPNLLFEARTDNNHVRVALLAEGGELLEGLLTPAFLPSAKKVGFTT